MDLPITSRAKMKAEWRSLYPQDEQAVKAAILADRERAKPYKIVGSIEHFATPEQRVEHLEYVRQAQAQGKTPF